MNIEQLRSFRIAGSAVFDWVGTFIGVLLILYVLKYIKVIEKITIYNYMVTLIIAIAISFPLHIFFNVRTVLTDKVLELWKK